MAEGPSGPLLCPHCTAPVAPDTSVCPYCGGALPAPAETPPQPNSPPELMAAKPGGRPIWLTGVLAGAILVALIAAGVLAYLVATDELRWLLRPQAVATLALEPRGADGTVSGSYRAGASLGGGTILFSVTPDGKATFREKDAPSSQVLAVSLTSELTATMTWAGVAIDGLGVPTAQERNALNDLATRQQKLLESLALIPLDLACRGENVITEKQVAALLFPLQMRFKYLTPDRTALVRPLILWSACDYGGKTKRSPALASVIQLTPAMPVPVVHGYFPFDQVGAVKLPASLTPWAQATCLNASLAMAPDARSAAGTTTEDVDALSRAKDSPTGPCGAMCRGACGPDCTLNNCTLTEEDVCEKDAQGRNTGVLLGLIKKYDCGLHQGCIDHDACYDTCNKTFGCGTWEAAYCRHGRSATLATYLADTMLWGYSWCDEAAIARWGSVSTSGWVRGYGPKPLSQVFEYLDETYSGSIFPDKCPVGTSAVAPNTARTPTRASAPTAARTPAPAAAPTVVRTPTRVATPLPTRVPVRTPTPVGLVWVMQGAPVVNVNKDPTRVVPPEPKYAGSVSEMSATAAKFTTHERYVVNTDVLYDFTITCDFAAPPAQLTAGRPITLTTTCFTAGIHTSGGEGLGEQFWYSSPTRGIISPADVLKLYPWAPRAAGSASKTWALTPPAATSAGANFQVVAALWNRPPCNVTWTYKAEKR